MATKRKFEAERESGEYRRSQGKLERIIENINTFLFIMINIFHSKILAKNTGIPFSAFRIKRSMQRNQGMINTYQEDTRNHRIIALVSSNRYVSLWDVS